MDLTGISETILAAVIGGAFVLIGQAFIAWTQKDKTKAETKNLQATAQQQQANALKTTAEAAQITAEQLADKLKEIDTLTERVQKLHDEAVAEKARADALVQEVHALKLQQGTNVATIAALNSQNASTLKLNNDLLIENKNLRDRVGILESEVNTERTAKINLEHKVRELEARIAELEAREKS